MCAMEKIGEREGKQEFRLWLRRHENPIELEDEPKLIDTMEKLSALGLEDDVARIERA